MTGHGCPGNWAYAFVGVAVPAGSSAGTPGILETLLFEADGASWPVVNRSTDCADVAAAIYRDACGTY